MQFFPTSYPVTENEFDHSVLVVVPNKVSRMFLEHAVPERQLNTEPGGSFFKREQT